MIQNIQNGSENVSIVLPTPTRLSGACLTEHGIAAVDGHSPYIFLFDNDGCFKAAIPARRPYSSISTNDRENFVCCGCGCDKNIYFLSCCFEESGVMTPTVSSGKAVSASFYAEPEFDNCIAVTFDRSIMLFRSTGEYISTLKQRVDGTYYLCFQNFPGGNCVAYENESENIICVNNDSQSKKCVLSKRSCISPKAFMLKPCGDILCVVGYRYLYNFLLPILTDSEINTDCNL